MFPNGIIYQRGKSKASGEINLRPTTIVRIAYHLTRGIGGGLVAFSIISLIFNFYPILKEEVSYEVNKASHPDFGELISKSNAEELGLDPFFSIYVPKIDAKAEIIPNVNAGNYNEYTQALQNGVAHAAGTFFPGQGRLIYLFSHSTDSPLNFARDNAVFYLLRKLEKGDEVVVYFMNKEYKYKVENIVTTSPNDTSWIQDKNEGEKLVLQTCDPPGTSINRLIIEAVPVN